MCKDSFIEAGTLLDIYYWLTLLFEWFNWIYMQNHESDMIEHMCEYAKNTKVELLISHVTKYITMGMLCNQIPWERWEHINFKQEEEWLLFNNILPFMLKGLQTFLIAPTLIFLEVIISQTPINW